MDMKRQNLMRWVSGVLSALCLLPALPAVPAAAASEIAMRISKTAVNESELGKNRLQSVDVTIEGNENGFYAAEFGIAYDSRLSLQSITPCCKAAESFLFSSTSENHMIWFSGANVDPANASTSGRTQLFRLDFVLPEDYKVGDEYVVTYEWSGVDGSSAFWYKDKKTDISDTLMAYSRAGSISIPSPDAPRLNKTSLEINPYDSAKLVVENANAGGVWFSDNESIATVENGVVTGVSPGSCVVSVFLDDASTLLSCDVTVREEFVYSMFDTAPIKVFSRSQVVRLEYPNAVGSVSWVSSNPNVVTVDNGLLKTVGNGTAQIIATNNGISKMRTVTVQLGATPEPTTQPTTQPTAQPTTTPTTKPATKPTAPAPADLGDVNLDGKTDIMDVIALNKSLLGITKLDETARGNADTCKDGTLDANDSLILLKFVLEMIDTLPVLPNS